MGIDISTAKAVSINDTHENGVDTSLERNPTGGRLQGIPLFHVFKRNYKGKRRDDGNPLIHALKGRSGFTITPFWKAQLMRRADIILGKLSGDLKDFDCCVPIPSSSPFCTEFAARVSDCAGIPLLMPCFLRKRSVGEVLHDSTTSPPKLRPAQRGAFTSQLNTWKATDLSAPFQAKHVDTSIRTLFDAFALTGEPPDLEKKRVLMVDDLLATGSSALSVRNVLANQLGAKVVYISFLSRS